MSKTLLQRALKHTPKRVVVRPLTAQDERLALAWLKGEITASQVRIAYKKKKNKTSTNNSSFYRVANALKRAYKKKRLVIKRIP